MTDLTPLSGYQKKSSPHTAISTTISEDAGVCRMRRCVSPASTRLSVKLDDVQLDPVMVCNRHAYEWSASDLCHHPREYRVYGSAYQADEDCGLCGAVLDR